MIDVDADFEAKFQAARELHKAGQLAHAEAAYQPLLIAGYRRETVLQALFDLYIQAGRPKTAIEVLDELLIEAPDSLTYHAHLANLMQQIGLPEAAIGRYESLLERQPQLADGHFSIALLYKQAMRYGDAERAYKKAIELGLSRRGRSVFESGRPVLRHP